MFLKANGYFGKMLISNHQIFCVPLFLGVQPVPLRQRVNAGQCLLQEAGRQEMAQYGQSKLH